APVGRIHSIEADALGFSYGRRHLFSGLTFRAGTGELLVLESPSGSGKTTLLQVLLGLLPAQEGSVRINGRPLEPGEAAAYWPRISYSRQQVFLIHDSIERNITLEEQPSKPLRLAQVLEATGLGRMLSAEGAGAGKIVRENGGNLSGGQQQRIALARALYREADLYLLDEPFSELDRASVADLQELLQAEVAAGKIVLLVTHQPETIPGARRIHLHESTPQHTGTAYARLRSVGS
ncbi:MAG: ATP-binding cassette domain-containing protein, partial [Chitinophagaceae bacterium]